MNCFFVFEQTKITNLFDDLIPMSDETMQDRRQRKGQTLQIDPRYDVLLATLLNDSLDLDNRINILSWNYDYQIELAYQEFCPGKSLNIFPNAISIIQENFTPRVVKLNGTAGLFYKQDTNVFSPIIKDNEIKINENTDKLPDFDAMITFYSNFLENKSIEICPFLNFAWEANSISQKSIKYAQQIMRQTEVLVVIGYSFPNFNRIIDSKILLNAKKLKRTYIQSPESNVHDIAQRFKWLMKETNNVVPYTDIEQFFIPYELDQNLQSKSGVRRRN